MTDEPIAVEEEAARPEAPIPHAAVPEAPDPYELRAAEHESRVARTAATSRVLRGFGGLTLLAAVATVMFQHWEGATDVFKYLVLLGVTATLPVVALMSGIGLREGRGARTLFGLALTVVPAHFSILGGIVYSQWIASDVAATMPGPLVWAATDPMTAGWVVGLGLLVLVPLTFVSFTVLARSRRRTLTAIFLAANGALLIPFREPWFVGVVASALAVAVIVTERRHLSSAPALRTLDGLWARALLPVPLVIVMARQLALYGYSSELGTVLFAITALAMVSVADGLAPDRAAALRRSALAPAALAWCNAHAVLAEYVTLAPSDLLLVLSLPFALLLAGVSLRGGAIAPFYRRSALAVAGLGVTVAMLLEPTPQASILAIAVGTLYVGYGSVQQRPTLTVLGGVGAIGALVVHIARAMHGAPWLGWVGLAALGVTIIIGASALERWSERGLA